MYNLWLRGGFIRPDRALGSTVQQEKGVKRARKNKLRRLVTRSGLRLSYLAFGNIADRVIKPFYNSTINGT